MVAVELDVIETSADMLHICAFHSADDYETAKKDKMDVDPLTRFSRKTPASPSGRFSEHWHPKLLKD